MRQEYTASIAGAALSFRAAIAITLALAASAHWTAPASAGSVSARVRISCASDYFAYCSKHAVGSPGVRQCMRAAGPKLSKRCVNALVASGEVSQSEVARRAAQLR